MRRRLPVILGSLFGSFAVYFAVASCNPAVPNANAQSACTQWQVMIVDSRVAANITGDITQIYGRAYDMPAGWEPFGTWGVDVIARRCAN